VRRRGKAVRDLGARERVGGGGERDARNVREALVQHGQLQVLRAKIVAPLRYAVRLVDREQRDARTIEQLEAAGREQSFGRHVEQVEFAGDERTFDRGGFARAERRIQECRPHAELAQRFHLVVHQRDQRRDDDAGAVAHERRNLVAQRLAGAGGHQHQRIAAGDDVIDDGRLVAAERVVAEHVAQHGTRIARLRGVEEGRVGVHRLAECTGAEAIPVRRGP